MFFATSASDLIGMLIGVGIPTFLFVFFFVKVLRCYKNYTLSSAFKKLGYINNGTAEEFAAMLDREVESSCLFAHKKITLIERWICIHGKFSMKILSAEGLVWAYIFVLNGTFYQVRFNYTNGHCHVLPSLWRKTCFAIFSGVESSYPDVWIGYHSINKSRYAELTRENRKQRQAMKKNAER